MKISSDSVDKMIKCSSRCDASDEEQVTVFHKPNIPNKMKNVCENCKNGLFWFHVDLFKVYSELTGMLKLVVNTF